MYLKEQQLNNLKKSSIFAGLDINDIDKYLKEIKAFPKTVGSGQRLVEQGDLRSDIHIVLSGAARGERLGADGRSVTVNEFTAGGVFGDMLSGAEEHSPVSVTMEREGEILAIPFSAMLTVGESCRQTGEQVLRNLIGEIAKKYFALQRRLDVLLCPTLRGKIAAYLLSLGAGQQLLSPHSRQQQAGILGCDRSALSRELSRMEKDGLIYFRKGEFEILDRARLAELAQQ